MKITPVSTKINNVSAYKCKTNKQWQTYESHDGIASYPANYYTTSFKGFNLTKMYEEYNWYINHDRIPAVKSFLKMCAPKEEMDQFLTHILNTHDRSYEFIDSITSMPREQANILKALTEKVGYGSKNIMTFLPDSPYSAAYSRYIKEKFDKAPNLTELLKIRPDWSGEMLMKKYISKAGNDELKIGNMPKQIPVEHWEQIVSYLREKMEYGIKSRKKIDNLTLGSRTYEFLFFTEGKSSKNVFGVFAPQIGKKYIIKIDSPDKRSLDEPFALGTLAKIDKYLTSNNSRNSAPLCYYDHKGNYSIYKYINHTHVTDNTKDLNVIKKHLPDFNALGLDYNDTVGYKNFFMLNESSLDTHYRMYGYNEALNKQEWISVDNDHVTYNNRLQPSVTGYNKFLPNGMGIAV